MWFFYIIIFLLFYIDITMYDKNKLLEVLLRPNFRTIDDSGKPFTPSTKIYRIIADKMKEFNCNISPKHIYVIINENRNGFKDKILTAFNIKVDDAEVSNNISSCSVETAKNNSNNSVSKEFDIIISSEQWKNIMPVRRLYGRRFKYVLQSGWTDIIAEKVWQQQKFSCTISFKKHDVHLSCSARYYISIHGSCKECNALILGKIMRRPCDDVDVKIHFTAFNVEEENHLYEKKRQLRGQRREIVTKTLIENKMDAITFRREEAKRLKDFGDVEPSIIPNAAVLRKAKEQSLLEKHGFSYVNPVLNLLESSKQGKYCGAIHSIGLLEFFCIYWSPEQQLLYNARNTKNFNSFMTIDATGGVIKRSSKDEPPIFLYQCVFIDTNGSVPVFQMISADHKSMHIAYFLRKIISKGNQVPRMVVCDFGWAILIAVAEIFAKCSDLRDYMKKCYNILHGYDSLPSCFIRLDVSHFICMISRWNCLKHKDNLLVRKFYLRSISQAYKMTSLEELSTLFEAIIVVALSEYVGVNENGKELPSESRLRYLNTLIKSTIIPELSSEIDENLFSHDTDSSEEADKKDISDWFQWSANIYDNAKQLAINCTEGTVINACFNPDFANIMKTRLMPYVVLWSGVMRSHFNIGEEIATSSSVEVAFADLKNRAFKGQLPMRADKFVHQHLDYLDGRIKLTSCEKDSLIKPCEQSCEQQNHTVHNHSSASSVEIQANDTLNVCSSPGTINSHISDVNITDFQNENNIMINTIVDNEDEINCNVRENWRGLIRESPETQCSTKKRRKPSYLDKCPEWDYIKSARDQNIPLIRNGSISKSVTMDKKIISINQTCAFDAILHLVASAIATIKRYEENIKFSENRIISLALSILHTGKIIQSHYNERAKILLNLSLFSDAVTMYTRAISKLDANCNVAHLITYLFTDIPSCRKTIECSCTSSRTRQTVELNLNVDDVLMVTTKCRQCLTTVNENVEYGPHLFIDTSIFTDDSYKKRDKTIAHSLDTITTQIKLKSKLYLLIGVVHYLNFGDGSGSSGHYVAYARCGSHWYAYDDLKKKDIR